MNEITLIIPAKEEPNALPLVLNEIKEMNLPVNTKLRLIMKHFQPWQKCSSRLSLSMILVNLKQI